MTMSLVPPLSPLRRHSPSCLPSQLSPPSVPLIAPSLTPSCTPPFVPLGPDPPTPSPFVPLRASRPRPPTPPPSLRASRPRPPPSPSRSTCFWYGPLQNPRFCVRTYLQSESSLPCYIGRGSAESVELCPRPPHWLFRATFPPPQGPQVLVGAAETGYWQTLN